MTNEDVYCAAGCDALAQYVYYIDDTEISYCLYHYVEQWAKQSPQEVGAGPLQSYLKIKAVRDPRFEKFIGIQSKKNFFRKLLDKF